MLLIIGAVSAYDFRAFFDFVSSVSSSSSVVAGAFLAGTAPPSRAGRLFPTPQTFFVWDIRLNFPESRWSMRSPSRKRSNLNLGLNFETSASALFTRMSRLFTSCTFLIVVQNSSGWSGSQICSPMRCFFVFFRQL